MQCTRPRFIHPSNEPQGIYVPCGKCICCRVNRRREWTQRLLHESFYQDSAYFITLTYDEEHVPIDDNGNEAVSKSDVMQFIKDLRNKYRDVKIRYFVGSEYGPETGRPH